MKKILQFIKQVREELNRVVWPTQEATIRYTAVVILVSLAVGAYLSLVDAFAVRFINEIVLGG